MASRLKPVRFSRDEFAAITLLVGEARQRADSKLMEKLAKKLANCIVTDRPALGVRAAIEAMESVLGRGGVALAAHADETWYSIVYKTIARKGLTAEDFVAMATVHQRRGWSGVPSFEKTVQRADELLAEYHAHGDGKYRHGFATSEEDMEEP